MSSQSQTSQLRCGEEMVSINDPPPDLHWENKTLYHKVWIKFEYKLTIAETPIRVVFIGGKCFSTHYQWPRSENISLKTKLQTVL